MFTLGIETGALETARSAMTYAQENGYDTVLFDTAGRLHNKINLMNELTKIKNVMKKVIPDAPHEILLVLDGSTGQNAFEQAKQFTAATEVNALAVTKLDGTAKGGCRDRYLRPFPYPREIYRTRRGDGGFASIPQT